MSWFILSLLYIIFISFANIFRKILLKDDTSDAYASAIIFQILGAIIVGTFALWNGFVMPEIDLYPLNFLFTAVFWGIATVCSFKASQYLEASEVTIISTLNAVVVITASLIFLGESFTLLNLIGTLLIIISIIYLSYASNKMVFNKGVIYALLFTFFSGIATVNDAFLIERTDPLSYLAIGFLLPAIFLVIIQPISLKRMKPLLKPTMLKKNIIFSFFYAIAGIAFFYAIAEGGQASQVGTIARSSVILTVLLAAVFLNERSHLRKKVICAILVTIGVLLLR